MSTAIPLSVNSRRRPLHGGPSDHTLAIYENPIPILFGCPACPLMMAMQAKYYHSDDSNNSESWQCFINPRAVQVSLLNPLAMDVLYPLFVNICVNQLHGACLVSKSKRSIDSVIYCEASYLFLVLFQGLRQDPAHFCNYDIFLGHAPKVKDLESHHFISDAVDFATAYRLDTLLTSPVTHTNSEIANILRTIRPYEGVGAHDPATCTAHTLTGSPYTGWQSRSSFMQWPEGVQCPTTPPQGYYRPPLKDQVATALLTAVDAVLSYTKKNGNANSSSRTIRCSVLQSSLGILRSLVSDVDVEAWVDIVVLLSQQSTLPPPSGDTKMFSQLHDTFRDQYTILVQCYDHSWVCFTGVGGLSHFVVDNGTLSQRIAMMHPRPQSGRVVVFSSCQSTHRRDIWARIRFPNSISKTKNKAGKRRKVCNSGDAVTNIPPSSSSSSSSSGRGRRGGSSSSGSSRSRGSSSSSSSSRGATNSSSSSANSIPTTSPPVAAPVQFSSSVTRYGNHNMLHQTAQTTGGTPYRVTAEQKTREPSSDKNDNNARDDDDDHDDHNDQSINGFFNLDDCWSSSANVRVDAEGDRVDDEQNRTGDEQDSPRSDSPLSVAQDRLLDQQCGYDDDGGTSDNSLSSGLASASFAWGDISSLPFNRYHQQYR